MEILCTRPGCSSPHNHFDDLDDPTRLKTTQQKYCTSCGMHLILGGRYLTEKLLGQGGFGAAFLASDRYTPTMRKCVVKQFQPIGNLDDDQLALAQELFEREAHVLERIGNRHPQIPDLFAFFPLIVPSAQGSGNNQYFYLVQEYIKGEDLEQELKRKGKLPEAEIKEILVSMLGVLDFVHGEGTIHRDIKPSNIMRRSDNTLHLLDFGAVKEVATGAGAASASQRSTGIYSPGYAPPEQMRGAQVYPATDLYALAVTCIVLLTGESPETLFDGYNNKWDWRKFANIDTRLAAVFDLMLETTPGDRPKSAEVALKLLNLPSKSAPSQSQAISSAQGTRMQPKGRASTPPTRPKAKAKPSPPPAVPAQQKQQKVAPAKSQSPIQTAPNISVIPLLIGSAFTGFEGTLLFVIAGNMLGGSVGIGVWGAIMGGLIFAIARQFIEATEMTILAVVTLVASFFLASASNIEFVPMLMIAVLVGAGFVAAIALFTLIYRILQKIF